MSKTGTSLQRNVRRTEQGARSAATGRWMAVLARCGYAAKGVVYLIIGVVSVQVAMGARGGVTDQKGALQTILAQPFGPILLGVVAVGLFAYGIYSLVEARYRRIGLS